MDGENDSLRGKFEERETRLERTTNSKVLNKIPYNELLLLQKRILPSWFPRIL